MNIKKIVSAITAFALSATMFAGFSAHAAEVTYTQDYEAESATADWTTSTSDRYTPMLKTDEENTWLGVNMTQRYNNGCTLTSPNYSSYVSGAEAYKLEFDAAIGYTNGNKNPEFYVNTSDGQLLALTTTNGTTWTINGNSEQTLTFATSGYTNAASTADDASTSTWYNYTIIYDNNGNTNLTVKDMEGATVFGPAVITSKTSTGALTTMSFATQRYFANFEIDNVVITKLTPAAFTLSATEATIDSTTTTTATVNVTDVVGEVTVESDNTEVATVAYADGVVTITYVGDGVANIAVKSTNDGLTKEETIAVTSGTVATTTVTVQYVNAADETEQLTTAATIPDVKVGSNIDLTSYTDDVTEYTKNGITYLVAHNDDDVSSVTVEKDMVYQLKYTLTEKTYAATVNAPQHSKVVITGTSTSGEEVNETLYTDYATDSVTVNLPEGTYAVTSTKGGYTDAAASLVVTKDGGAVTMNTAFVNADSLFYEDFETTGNVNSYNVFGGYRLVSAGVMQTMWNGLINNTVTVPFDATSTTGTKVEIDSLYAKLGVTQDKSYSIAFNGTSGSAVLTLTADGNKDGATPSTLTITNGTDTITLLETELVDGAMKEKTVTSDLVITFANDKAVGSYNGEAFEFAVSDVNIASFTIASANINNTVLEMSAIKAYKYVAPELTVATATPADFGDVAVATGSVEAYEVDMEAGTKAETTSTVDLADVTTVYIKVENVKDEAVMPAVVVDEKTYAPTYKYEINSNNYFVYQFVGIDLTDAVVTYEGAADVNL